MEEKKKKVTSPVEICKLVKGNGDLSFPVKNIYSLFAQISFNNMENQFRIMLYINNLIEYTIF